MTHPVSTQAADARPDSTIPYQATSSKNSGGEIIHFLWRVSSSPQLWNPVREWEKESVTWKKRSQARLVAPSSLVSIKSHLCCSLHDPLSAKNPTVAIPAGKTSTGHSLTKSSCGCWIQSSGTSTEHLSIPNTATSSAGLDSTGTAGRLWWPSPVKTTEPRVNLLQKSRFLKRFREGAYKKGNLSP